MLRDRPLGRTNDFSQPSLRFGSEHSLLVGIQISFIDRNSTGKSASERQELFGPLRGESVEFDVCQFRETLIGQPPRQIFVEFGIASDFLEPFRHAAEDVVEMRKIDSVWCTTGVRRRLDSAAMDLLDIGDFSGLPKSRHPVEVDSIGHFEATRPTRVDEFTVAPAQFSARDRPSRATDEIRCIL